jgi:broad specificity phosphatase PhoE
MTDLVLVRHGETTWHGENRYAGVSEVPLAGRGLEQAARLATWASSAGLAAIWSSPLSRALATAAPCADRAGLQIHIDARLRELDFGDGEGLTALEMGRRFPAALAAFAIDPVAGHLPGGEDPVAAVDRFVACLRDIVDIHPDRRVIVVTHTTVIRLALCQLLGTPLEGYRRRYPSIGNCALTEIRLRGQEAALLQLNVPVDEEQPRGRGETGPPRSHV